jgi:hypothetical protein
MNNAIDLNVDNAADVPTVMREAATQYDHEADMIDIDVCPMAHAMWRELADHMRLAADHIERRLGEYL